MNLSYNETSDLINQMPEETVDEIIHHFLSNEENSKFLIKKPDGTYSGLYKRFANSIAQEMEIVSLIGRCSICIEDENGMIQDVWIKVDINPNEWTIKAVA